MEVVVAGFPRRPAERSANGRPEDDGDDAKRPETLLRLLGDYSRRGLSARLCGRLGEAATKEERSKETGVCATKKRGQSSAPPAGGILPSGFHSPVWEVVTLTRVWLVPCVEKRKLDWTRVGTEFQSFEDDGVLLRLFIG